MRLHLVLALAQYSGVTSRRDIHFWWIRVTAGMSFTRRASSSMKPPGESLFLVNYTSNPSASESRVKYSTLELFAFNYGATIWLNYVGRCADIYLSLGGCVSLIFIARSLVCVVAGGTLMEMWADCTRNKYLCFQLGSLMIQQRQPTFTLLPL